MSGNEFATGNGVTIPLSEYELYLAIVVVVAFTICWGIAWKTLNGKDDALRIVFGEGHLLRMMTVVLIIVAAAYLALVGKLSSEVATLFAGVAGYVLGGITKSSKEE